jgi:hypothetical protein
VQAQALTYVALDRLSRRDEYTSYINKSMELWKAVVKLLQNPAGDLAGSVEEWCHHLCMSTSTPTNRA